LFAFDVIEAGSTHKAVSRLFAFDLIEAGSTHKAVSRLFAFDVIEAGSTHKAVSNGQRQSCKLFIESTYKHKDITTQAC
jgi:hypothetical protein